MESLFDLPLALVEEPRLLENVGSQAEKKGRVDLESGGAVPVGALVASPRSQPGGTRVDDPRSAGAVWAFHVRLLT